MTINMELSTRNWFLEELIYYRHEVGGAREKYDNLLKKVEEIDATRTEFKLPIQKTPKNIFDSIHQAQKIVDRLQKLKDNKI